MEFNLCVKCASRNKIAIYEKAEEKDCFLCKGIFLRTDIGKKPEGDFKKFSVSVILPLSLETREEEVWAHNRLKDGKALKNDISFAIRKKMEEEWNVEYDYENPEISFVYNFETGHFSYEFQPVYIYGKYQKLSRNLSQSRWHCRECFGEGCPKCAGSGKMYVSVEELIGTSLKEEFLGTDAILHAAGREDVDAVMLGEGRPFVLEIPNAKKRNIDLTELEKKINESKDVQVKLSCFVNKHAPGLIHGIKPDKEYRALVEAEEELTPEKEKLLGEIIGESLKQRTPTRVSHRRADLIRSRAIKEMKWKKIDEKRFELIIRAQSGTYIKEFISGDNGRTKPNVSEIIIGAKCIELDVIGIDSSFSDYLMKEILSK